MHLAVLLFGADGSKQRSQHRKHPTCRYVVSIVVLMMPNLVLMLVPMSCEISVAL